MAAAVAKLIPDFKGKCDQACQAAEQFSNLYYETFDKERHKLMGLYTDASKLVWNGIDNNGKDKINAFIIDLPSCEHDVFSVDSQPISSVASPDSTTILVVCEGSVKYGTDKQKRYFTQTFILTSQNNTWKVMSDCFRFIEP